MTEPIDPNANKNDPENPTNPANPVNPQKPADSDKPAVPAAPAADATAKELEDYKKKMEPILQAIYRDPEVYKKVNESYQIVMGVKQPDKPADPENKDGEDKDKNPTKPATDPLENDNRNALISQSVKTFESAHGMDKMKPEDKQVLNNKILTELKVILDPMGTGKSGAELLNGVPVAKVSEFLERAYFYATREEREAAMKEDAIKQHNDEERGLLGAISGGTINENDVKLTEKEKAIAKKQGVTEEKYLANKKEILKRKGSIA